MLEWRKLRMAVSYKKLFKILIDRDLKKKDLCRMTGISASTISKMAKDAIVSGCYQRLFKDEKVSMDTVSRICEKLQCTFDDVAEIVPEKNFCAGSDKSNI